MTMVIHCQVSDYTKSILNDTALAAVATWTSIDNRTVELSAVHQTVERHQSELDRTNSSLSVLRLRLTEAMAAASMVSLCVGFVCIM